MNIAEKRKQIDDIRMQRLLSRMVTNKTPEEMEEIKANIEKFIDENKQVAIAKLESTKKIID